MDPTVVQYIGFGVVILILIWAVVEMSRRSSRRKKVGREALDIWVKMDAARAISTEQSPPDMDPEEPEEPSEEHTHTRAQQNGHYSESKRPL